MNRAVGTVRAVGVWVVLFSVMVWFGLVIVQVQEGRATASPPVEAVDAGRLVAARIGADPAAVGKWMVLEGPAWWSWQGWPQATAQQVARWYLVRQGEEQAASWVGRLEHAEGFAQAVVVYVGAEGVVEPRAEGGTSAVFCFPGRESGAWVPLFWDGPWAEDRQASAEVLMSVCRAHAPLALEGLPTA